MQSDYEKTCKTYKELIMEVVNKDLLPPSDWPYWRVESPDYSYWRERYKEVKKPWGNELERIKPIEEDFKKVINELVHSRGPFFGYDIGGGRLAKNYYDVQVWKGNIKRIKRLTHPLDIINAICNEMARQEKEKGLVLETPGAGGEARQKRNSVTVQIEGEGVTLTHYKALCLLAYQDAVKNKRPYITPDIIAERVWPDAPLKARTERLKPHWSNLRNKLEKKGFKLADFSMKDVDGVRNYQLGKPPAWLKEITFPKTLALPFKLVRRG